jgi:hypothetical protein
MTAWGIDAKEKGATLTSFALMVYRAHRAKSFALIDELRWTTSRVGPITSFWLRDLDWVARSPGRPPIIAIRPDDKQVRPNVEMFVARWKSGNGHRSAVEKMRTE